MTETDEPQSSAPTIRFIRDEPADDDFFSTHTRLAEAIVTSIRGNAEIKVIGLLGRWGSGKSTVAKKVVELLTNPSEAPFSVFSYDAWLHQSDPVRRSFLESLLSTLVASITVTPGKWDERLKELNGEIHDTDTVETPTLSDDARWLLISLLPVPLGVGLIGLDTIKEAFGGSTTIAGIATFWVAASLTLMPLWVWAIRYLRHRPWKSEQRKAAGGILDRKFWRIVDEKGKATPLLPLFINKAVTRTSTRTFRSADPSSLEFGRVFQEIMKEATQGGQRFVIVIDNLDRIGETEALQMWATIRSFFLAAHETDGLAHEPYHPTVILPIDRHAIEQMFGVPGDETIGRDRATSFISKTFDVIFEVTEPVASDWRAFLDQQMREVFGALYQPRWGFWTRRIFEQQRPKTQENVTPREINKLVNRIGALFLQWHDQEIAVEVMALYVIRRKDFEVALLPFLQQTETELGRDVPDWKLQLAALHYGVPLDKAAQVLLDQPVRTAISTLDRDDFGRLAGIVGFGETFEIVTTNLPPASSGASADFEVVTNAALLLASLPAADEVWEGAAWSNLTEQFLTHAGPDRAMRDFADRIDCLAKHLPPDKEQDFADHVTEGIGALLSRDDVPTAEVDSLRAAAIRVIDYAEAKGLEAPLFGIEGDAPLFLKRLSQIARQEIWPNIRTELNSDQLGEALVEMLRSPATHALAPSAIQALAADEDGEIYGGTTLIVWPPIAEAAAEIVRSPDAHGVTASPGITALGHLSRRSKEAATLLTAIIDEGRMAACADQAHADGKWDALHSIAALLIWRGANFAPPSGTSWRALLDARADFVPSVLRQLRLFAPGSAMRRVWDSYHASHTSQTLSEAMIRHMVETDDLGMINLNHILKNIYRYRDPVPWRLRDRFVGLLEMRGNFWVQLEQAPLGQPLHDAAQILAQQGTDEEKRVHDIVQGRVEAATKDDWTAALTKGDQPFKMATGFLKTGTVRLKGSSELFAAMTAQLELVATKADRATRERWFLLTLLLQSKPAKNLAKALGKRLLTAPPRQALKVLKAGGTGFLKATAFNGEPGQAIEGILLPQLRTKEGREWLKDNRQEVKTWVERAPRAVQVTVDNALRQHAKSRSEERRYSADIIRRGLVSLPEQVCFQAPDDASETSKMGAKRTSDPASRMNRVAEGPPPFQSRPRCRGCPVATPPLSRATCG